MSLRAVDLGGVPAAATAPGGGPTPYPAPEDEAAWPGKGPIRCFDWMMENHKHYWTQRAKDQGAIVFVGDSLSAHGDPSDSEENIAAMLDLIKAQAGQSIWVPAV